MKRTVIEEYDSEGKLTRKTITEESYQTWTPIWSVCTCGQTAVCPLHQSGVRPWYIIYGTTITSPSISISTGANT